MRLTLSALPLFLWSGLIFLLSQTPNLSTGLLLDFPIRKGGHFAVYAFFAFLYLFGEKWREAPVSYPLAILASLAYAVTDEWHQGFVPGRHPSGFDVGIDLLGALAGCCLFYSYARRFPKRLSEK